MFIGKILKTRSSISSKRTVVKDGKGKQDANHRIMKLKNNEISWKFMNNFVKIWPVTGSVGFTGSWLPQLLCFRFRDLRKLRVLNPKESGEGRNWANLCKFWRIELSCSKLDFYRHHKKHVSAAHLITTWFQFQCGTIKGWPWCLWHRLG